MVASFSTASETLSLLDSVLAADAALAVAAAAASAASAFFAPGSLTVLSLMRSENIPLPAWYETMQTVIFFAILLIIAGYVLRNVILQHRGLREALARLPLVIWLREFWRGLQHVWRAAQQELVLWTTPTAHSTPVIAEDAAIPITLSGMDDLSPREQVIALYQHTLQQAEQHGLPRPPSQTPNEFARALAKTLPDAAADVSTLTAQFSTARYSSQTVQAEQVSLVRRSMQQVVHWLRKHAGSKAS